MKKKLFFVLMSIFLCFGCGQNVSEGGFWVLKPGHFCQLGAVAVAGDTVFIAGSFIAEENPNLSVQPIYSYVAAIDGADNLLWQRIPKEPDYIRWKCIEMNSAGSIILTGESESPLEAAGFKLLELDIPNGEPINELRSVPSLPCGNTVTNIPLPEAFEEQHLVNKILANEDNTMWIASTIKNAQGPCLWQLGNNDSIHKQTCLAYWPFHGSTLLLRYGSCTVMAFNAADGHNEHSAHVVVVNDDLEVVWQQSIESQHPFIINHAVINANKIYVAGTWEMGEKGSALAVKVLDLPSCP